jgi:hypothetical protein
MKSVLFRPTGRFNEVGQEIKEPIFLNNRHTSHKSVFVNADPAQGLDTRFNAAATTADQATGYQILIDTMTYIKQQESKQTYYELGNFGLTPSSFVPIAVGDGSWAANILTRRTFMNSGDFEAGLVRQGSHNARNTNSDVSMDSITLPTFIWDDGVQYTLAEIEQALVASNWDIIASKHASRYKKYQLGIQAITFLGTKSGNMEGLFINTATNVNTSFITAPISGLNAANFLTFVKGLISTYWTNTNATVLPTHFVIPMTDYLGLMALVPGSAGTFPVPMLTYLENAFKTLCGPNFKIIGNAYGDAANSNALRGVNKYTYALYRHDPESLRMDIPVDFTVTQPNSIDNFHFQDVAYCQLTGVGFYKPLETLLFQYNG